MELKTFFFDSYAFYEILGGNPSYKSYTKDIAIVTTAMNLMELHYGLMTTLGKAEADNAFDHFRNFAIDIDDTTIKQANALRRTYHKRGLSYIDCIGYTLARARGIPFLTGDRQFKDMVGVEFVK